MKILALDLSLTSTGWACGAPGEKTPVRCGRIVPGDSRNGMTRLGWIRSSVLRLTVGVTLVVVEGYSFGSQNRAHSLGELGGVIRLALHDAQVPYVDVPPNNLKTYATGKGNAAKDAVFGEAIRRLGYGGANNDEADALWLHAMAMDHYGSPVVKMPEQNKKGLLKVQWPTL